MAGFENDIGFAKNFDFTEADNQAPVESNGLVTNGKMWIGSTAVNAGGTHINVGSIISPLGTLSIGYSSPNITIDTVGGGIGIDSLTPNSGTSPVVPDANGNITLQGTGSITTVGGTNSLTAQLTGLTQHAVLVGAGTATINSGASLIGTTGTVFVGNTGADPGWATSLAGSFTYVKSESGGNVTVTVSNTSNTASSTALLKTLVAGTSAGDPYYEAMINGGQSWTFGLDNSDSDAFVVSSNVVLGTNNVMRVATTGEITFPLQSCFYGQLATNTVDCTGDGTSVSMGGGTAALTEIYDRNGDFTVGNGAGTAATYTAPVTGNVNLVFNILLQQVITAATCIIEMVTSNRTYSYGNTGTSFTGNQPLAMSALADMDAGDTVTFNVSVSGMTKIVDIYGPSTTDCRTFIQGWLLG